MKTFLTNIITSKYVGILFGLILGALAVLQEFLISGGNTSTAWILGLVISIVTGLFWEAGRYVISGKKYQILNVLYWLLGGVIGIGIIYLIF